MKNVLRLITVILLCIITLLGIGIYNQNRNNKIRYEILELRLKIIDNKMQLLRMDLAEHNLDEAIERSVRNDHRN